MLREDLRRQLFMYGATPLQRTEHGQFYEISGPLTGPNGRTLYVRAIWMDGAFVRRDKIRYSSPRQDPAMTFELYTDAVLTRDLPCENLCRGDVVKVIDHHPVPGGEDGYSIEVFNAVGDTIAVTSVEESALEPLTAQDVFNVRRLLPAG